MRTIVDIPENEIKALDLLGKKRNLSRAALVREAVEKYLLEENIQAKSNLDKYFGILKDDPTVFEGMDGLAWQKKMRAEWADRDAAIDKRMAENGGMNDKPQSDYKDK
jgi:hypothetical protein